MAAIVVPRWMLLWFLISSVLIVYDAVFILTRPASFPGGSLHWLFFPYDLYTSYDPVYGDLTDAFGVAQSYINLLEIAVVLLGLLLIAVFPTSSAPHLLLLISTSSTLFKTFLYFVYDEVDHSPHHQGKYALVNPGTWDAGYVGAFVVPTMMWVVFPTAVLINLGSQFARAANAGGKGKRA